VEHLRRFAQAVEQLESELSARTAHLAWSELPAATATRRREDRSLGGALPRSRLRDLPSALRRRALWRLLLEATQHAPSRSQLDGLVNALDESTSSRHGLRGGWIVRLNRTHLELHPPLERLFDDTGGAGRQLSLGFAELARAPRASSWIASLAAPAAGFTLPTPGSVTLPDGRRLTATMVPHDPSRPIPRTPSVVEIDARELPTRLRVRWPASGDRFHPLGCEGSRPLRRFLADAGVPARERRLVPLVFAHDELLWVAGLRPAHPRRVHETTRARLRLELQSGSPWRALNEEFERTRAGREQQLELFAPHGGPPARR
jgi:tRNA(Ile)-lysidine synthetase-like protein